MAVCSRVEYFLGVTYLCYHINVHILMIFQCPNIQKKKLKYKERVSILKQPLSKENLLYFWLGVHIESFLCRQVSFII